MVYVSLIFWVLASICNAVMDTCSHHYYNSIFTKYSDIWWNADRSWLNKYVDRDVIKGRRKLWGFIKYPVQLTDAWHLFKMLMIIFLAVSILTFNVELYTLKFSIYLILYGIVWNFAFSLFYNTILKQKQ